MADTIRFTQNQKEALDISKDQNFLVSASAGTGKTTVMVRRICDLVQVKRAELEKMLVVTFTRLAASEMKEKLFKELIDSQDDFCQQQSQKVDLCTVGTIHSFCAETIREYFYVVGVDPNFVVIEESDAKLLLEKSIDTVFERRYRFGTQLCDVVEKFCKDREDATLRNNVKELHKLFTCVESLADWFENTLSTFSVQKIENSFNEYFVDKAQKIKANLSDLILKMGQAGADGYVNRLEKIRQTMTVTDKVGLSKNLCGILETSISNKNEKYNEEFVCDQFQKDSLLAEQDVVVADVKKLIEQAKEITVAQQNDFCEKTCLEFCRFMIDLAQDVEKEFSLAKKEKNVVDFCDLEKMTLKILRDEEAIEQIRQRYDYVFVDEYQDVNGIQEQILQLVAKPKRLFCVGDVKQSIYGFRQANPEIFANKAKQYAQNLQDNKVVYMNDNFRCNAMIANFVNKIFVDAMTESFGKANYADTGILVADSKKRICDGLHPVEVVLIKNDKIKQSVKRDVYDPTVAQTEEICDGRAEGAYVAKKIKTLLALKREDGTSLSFGDVVILRRSVKSDAVDIYKQLLREGIPAVIKLEGDVSCKEISDLLCFFKSLDNFYDDYSLTATMLCCIGGFCVEDLASIATKSNASTLWQKIVFVAEQSQDHLSNKCKAFKDLMQKYILLKSTLTSGQLLKLLFEETSYEKFILALPNGQMRWARLISFVGQVDALSVAEVLTSVFSEEDFSAGCVLSDAVRIMTVHASKGLEFDVVFLTGLDTTFAGLKEKGNILLHDDCGMALKYTVNGEKIKTLRECFVEKKLKQRMKEEELRLLYVATTRAKRKLICTAVSNDYSKNPFFEATEATKMFDWLPLTASDKEEFFDFCVEESACDQVSTQAFDDDQKDQCATTQDADLKESFLRQRDWQYPRKALLDMPLKVVSSKLDQTLLNNDFDSDSDANLQPAYILHEPSVDEESFKDMDFAEIGKAYHKVFETCDLTNPDKTSLQKTLQALVAEGWFDQSVAQEIDLNVVSNTLSNESFVQLIKDAKIYRELPFLTTLPYDQLFGSGFDDEIMLQGVVDMLVLHKDFAVVVDFKVTKRPDKIRQRYQKQLNSYKLAVEKSLKIPAKAVVVSVLDGTLIEF